MHHLKPYITQNKGEVCVDISNVLYDLDPRLKSGLVKNGSRCPVHWM